MVTGNIVNVFDHSHGSELAADAAAAATSITVVDVDLDFNLDTAGGQLKIDDGTNSEILSYTVPSGSTGLINLGSALAHSYLTGTRVTVYPEVIERWADIVEPDGEDTLRCLVPHHLRALVPFGPRNMDDGTAEYVHAEFEEGDLVVRNVLGQPLRYYDIDLASGQIGGVRVLRDGIVYAYVQAQLDTSSKNLLDVAVFDGDGASGGVAALRLQAPTNNSPASAYGVTALAGANAAQVLAGDDTSDYLFDNAWANWTPTLTGWSANPTNTVYRYKQLGTMVVICIRQLTNGTSNATSKSISLPPGLTAATITNMRWDESCAAVDNGAALSTPARARVASGGTVVNFDKDAATTDGWTASGSHRIVTCTLIYEAA